VPAALRELDVLGVVESLREHAQEMGEGFR
jgi:hypothetical protein